MNWSIILPRLVALAAAVGAGLTAFTSAVTTQGDYKAAAVAGLSAVTAVWVHEEHSTERNATTAAASLTPAGASPLAAAQAAPLPTQADMHAAAAAVLGPLLGAPVTGQADAQVAPAAQ